MSKFVCALTVIALVAVVASNPPSVGQVAVWKNHAILCHLQPRVKQSTLHSRLGGAHAASSSRSVACRVAVAAAPREKTIVTDQDVDINDVICVLVDLLDEAHNSQAQDG
jgi:hypothetical protein